jgi:hypothetical protein
MSMELLGFLFTGFVIIATILTTFLIIYKEIRLVLPSLCMWIFIGYLISYIFWRY